MKVLWRFLLLLLLSGASHGVCAQQVKFVTEGRDKRIILFVHGLGGGADSFAARGAASWPELMRGDKLAIRSAPPLSSYSTAVILYPAGRDSDFSVPQLANNMREAIEDKSIAHNYSNIIFVAHSLGGVIVKKLLLEAEKYDPSFARKVKAVFLIGVPSTGNDLADFAAILPTLAKDFLQFSTGQFDFSDRLIEDLRSMEKNSFLEGLENDWGYHHKSSSARAKVFCAFEVKAYGGKLIVPLSRAVTDCDGQRRAINANHLNLVRPSSTEDEVYGWVRGRIATLYDRNSGGPPMETQGIEKIPVTPTHPGLPASTALNTSEITAYKITKQCSNARITTNSPFLGDDGEITVGLRALHDGACTIQIADGAPLYTNVGESRSWPLTRADRSGKYSIQILKSDMASKECVICVRLK